MGEKLEESVSSLERRINNIFDKLGNVKLTKEGGNGESSLQSRLSALQTSLQQLDQTNPEIFEFVSNFKKYETFLEQQKDENVAIDTKLQILMMNNGGDAAGEITSPFFQTANELNKIQPLISALDSPSFSQVLETQNDIKDIKTKTTEQSQVAAILQERLTQLLISYNQMTQLITARFVQMNEKISYFEDMLNNNNNNGKINNDNI